MCGLYCSYQLNKTYLNYWLGEKHLVFLNNTDIPTGLFGVLACNMMHCSALCVKLTFTQKLSGRQFVNIWLWLLLVFS